MPLALIVIGLILIIAAARDTQEDLFTLVEGEFTGSNNFLYWIAALAAVGAIGYVPKLKPFSVAFLVLILVAIFLNKGSGFFTQIQSFLSSTGSVSSTS